jgi:hypothetical protein
MKGITMRKLTHLSTVSRIWPHAGWIAAVAVISGSIALSCGSTADTVPGGLIGAGGGGGTSGLGGGTAGLGGTAGGGANTNIGDPCANNDPCPSGYTCIQGECQIRCGGARPPCPTGTACVGGFCTVTSGGTGGNGGASGGTGTAGGSGSPPQSPGYYGTPVTSTTPVGSTNACTNSSANASLGQLDMLIVEDSTGSMTDQTAAGPTKWKMITDALTTFVNDPASAGMGAGIEFFNGNMRNACAAATYATPSVPIATLNGNAAPIVAAIGRATVSGSTPTPSALQGALQYAATWQAANPTHKVIVVLATDGLPNRYANGTGTTCSGTSSGVDPTAMQKTLDAAAAGVAGPPSIPTYVIGVIGEADRASLTNLNDMAKYGGTGTAFIVDTAANAGKQFVAAMNAIREANKIACRISVPAAPRGYWVDFTKVTVTYSSGGGAPATLPWTSSAATCPATGGFYYDNNAAPTAIQLCASTCSIVEADSTAALQIQFGCLLPSDAGPPQGAGGAGGGPGTGGAGGGTTCLLDGQSCTSNADCCNGFCNQYGYCGVIIN